MTPNVAVSGRLLALLATGPLHCDVRPRSTIDLVEEDVILPRPFDRGVEARKQILQ